jgi:hypothetical protein
MEIMPTYWGNSEKSWPPDYERRRLDEEMREAEAAKLRREAQNDERLYGGKGKFLNDERKN